MRPLRALLVAALATACFSESEKEKPIEPTRHFASSQYNHTTTQSVSRTAHTVSGFVAELQADTVRYSARVTKDAMVEYVDVTIITGPTHSPEPPIFRRVMMANGTFPMIGDAVGLLEQIIRRARVVGGDYVSVPVMRIGGQVDFASIQVHFVSADSVVLADEGGEATAVHLTVDAQGHILSGAVPISKGRLWRDDEAE